METDKQAADVAVIIVNWNSGPLLRRCLKAVAAQTARPRRVILVDNASEDGSADDARSALPELQVLTQEANIGFAAANNLAAREARDCQWLATLNPDAFPRPDWLERLLDAARRYPSTTAFASCLLDEADPQVLDGAGDVYHTSGSVWRRFNGRRTSEADLQEKEVFSPCAAAALWRRDDFLRSGGFDESFFCYMEDVDLGFRQRLAGHSCIFVPDAVAEHVGSSTTGRRSGFAVYHGHRNLVWTFVKNMPAPMLWLYLPLHIAMNLFSLLWFTLLGRGCAIFRAKWHALRQLGRILGERKRVQLNRRISARQLRAAMRRGLLSVVRRARSDR